MSVLICVFSAPVMKQADIGFVCRECIPSGALTLDIALGGGFPKGRIIEVLPTWGHVTTMVPFMISLEHAQCCPS